MPTERCPMSDPVDTHMVAAVKGTGVDGLAVS
jgi:hypothetical protein